MLKWLTHNALGTYLMTRRKGVLVGQDERGNSYYRNKGAANWRVERRWVVFADGIEPEPTQVPPGWYGWLHHRIELPPSEAPLQERSWEREHIPNLTGTSSAYVPPGHVLRGGHRDSATGDYEAWRPE